MHGTRDATDRPGLDLLLGDRVSPAERRIFWMLLLFGASPAHWKLDGQEVSVRVMGDFTLNTFA